MKHFYVPMLCMLVSIVLFFSHASFSVFAENKENTSESGDAEKPNESDNSSESTPPEKPEVPMPILKITRNEMAQEIKPGQEFTVVVSIENLSKDSDVLEPVLTITPSDSIVLLENTSSKVISNIHRYSKSEVTLKLRALDEITYPSQSLNMEVKFMYYSGAGKSIGSASEKILIPALTNKGGVSAPIIQMTRKKLKENIEADKPFSLTLTIKNLSDTKIESPVLLLTPTDAFVLRDGTSSRTISSIEPQKSIDVTVNLQSMPEISSASQGIGTELKYRYTIGNTSFQGETSEKIWVPVVVNKGGAAAAPILQISRGEIQEPISTDKNFTVTFQIKNLSQSTIENAIATLTPTDSIMLLESSSSHMIPKIAPNESVAFPIQLKTASEIASTAQGVGIELKYQYTSKGVAAQGETSDKIWVPILSKSTGVSLSTPNLMIDSFHFNDTQIPAGSTFDFDFTFRNTSDNSTVENVVVAVEPGEGLSVNASSNTFFYPSLSAGGLQSQTIQLRALPTAKTASAKIDISFKYEYIKQKERVQVTSSQSISIPIFQPDRFDLTLASLPDTISANEESIISLNYINKGKSEIANVRAELEGNIKTLSKIQNLGNFESGKSGTIDFILIPEEVGKAECVLKVTYEDPNMEEQIREFPLQFTVSEAAPAEDPFAMEEVPQESKFPKKVLLIGIPLLLAIAGLLLWKRKRYKKEEVSEDEEDFEWEDEEEDIEEITCNGTGEGVYETK